MQVPTWLLHCFVQDWQKASVTEVWMKGDGDVRGPIAVSDRGQLCEGRDKELRFCSKWDGGLFVFLKYHFGCYGEKPYNTGKEEALLVIKANGLVWLRNQRDQLRMFYRKQCIGLGGVESKL